MTVAMSPSLAPVSPLNVFGRIVTAAQVEHAITENLQKWMRTYLRELERQDGRPAGSLPMVRSWTVANDVEKWPEDQLPAVVVVSQGISNTPIVDGDGVYTAVWDIAISSICSAATREASNDLAKLYTAAVEAVVLQQCPADGLVSGVVWTGATFVDVPQVWQRMEAQGKVTFQVAVTDVLSRYKGPLAPDDDPQDLGQAGRVVIDALPEREGSGQPPDLMHLVDKEAPPL